jgi:hypothetical protein
VRELVAADDADVVGNVLYALHAPLRCDDDFVERVRLASGDTRLLVLGLLGVGCGCPGQNDADGRGKGPAHGGGYCPDGSRPARRCTRVSKLLRLLVSHGAPLVGRISPLYYSVTGAGGKVPFPP